jgi:hypothetical protein
MHYTTAESSIYNPALAYTNTEPVINTNIPADPSQPVYQYNVNTNNVPAGYVPANKGNNQNSDFSPRVAHKRAERDEPLEEGLVMHIREAFLPFNDPSPSTRASKRYLVQLIGEYLRDEMTLKRFFKELSGLTSPISSVPGDIYRWLVHLLIYSDKDPAHKLMNFLLENGVHENDLEYGSVKRLLSMYNNLSDESEKKARDRPRIRKSVSKGLRNPPNKWAKEESQRLIQLVNDYGDKSWKKIAEHVGGGKTGAQCAQHWKRVLCPIIRKGSWDDEEELKLFHLVEKYGQSWKNIASEIGSRTDIQCRYQYFKSCMSREVVWSPQEDDLLMKKMNGENRDVHWVEVARYMARGRLTKIPRTALECRTRWEVLTSSPQTDIRTLSSSVNITLARDCPDLPGILPSDLDIGTVPEISDNDEDEDFEPSEMGALTLTPNLKDGEIVREPLATMIEA